MSDEENIEDIDEQMIDEVMNVISTDGYYQQAEIVKVTCPVCGEEFLGTKRHAGGFIAGHRAYHEFVNSQDMIIDNMGGI
jgi:uncharacterized protein (UPF0212 family)|tara:strand:- start:2780 stop:3019 length:240 start_codon:yes stop_codon:yes gene_type:complete